MVFKHKISNISQGEEIERIECDPCGAWAEWADWTGCSRTCSEESSPGIQSRHRECSGGKCKSGEAEQIKSCNLNLCPSYGQKNTHFKCKLVDFLRKLFQIIHQIFIRCLSTTRARTTTPTTSATERTTTTEETDTTSGTTTETDTTTSTTISTTQVTTTSVVSTTGTTSVVTEESLTTAAERKIKVTSDETEIIEDLDRVGIPPLTLIGQKSCAGTLDEVQSYSEISSNSVRPADLKSYVGPEPSYAPENAFGDDGVGWCGKFEEFNSILEFELSESDFIHGIKINAVFDRYQYNDGDGEHMDYARDRYARIFNLEYLQGDVWLPVSNSGLNAFSMQQMEDRIPFTIM